VVKGCVNLASIEAPRSVKVNVKRMKRRS
jgi:hypothetical protein